MRLVLAPSYYTDFVRELPVQRNPFGGLDLTGAHARFMGLPIGTSNEFPFDTTCPICNGTGEGKTSTYCQGCDGQGRRRTIGVILGAKAPTIFTTPLPKAFAPRFPNQVHVPAPRMRGWSIREIH